MATGKRPPTGRPQEPRIPRGFDSSDPERKGEVVPPSGRAPEGEGKAPGRAHEPAEEGGTRGR